MKQAYQDSKAEASKRYTPEEMNECFRASLEMIEQIEDKEERENLIDIFDRETYNFLSSHLAEKELMKMDERLQKIYNSLLDNKKKKEEKENNIEKKEPVKEEIKLSDEDIIETLKEIRFSETDHLINLDSMKRIPPIVKAVLGSPNVPVDLRKKYHQLDMKIEKLAPSQKKSIGKVLSKYADPATGVIGPVNLVVVLGELLTHKPKQTKSKENEMKKE